MSSRVPVRFVIVAVILLILIAALAFYLGGRIGSRFPENPLASVSSLENSPKLDETRRKVVAEYETKVAEYFKQREKAEKALRQELAKARDEDRQRLEQELSSMRQDMQGYADDLEAWRGRMGTSPTPEPPRPDSKEEEETEPTEPPAFEPPPPPPPPREDEDDESTQAFLALAAAGICIAEPALCEVALGVFGILGSQTTAEGANAVASTISQVQRGEPVSPQRLQQLGDLARETPGLAKPLGEILGTLLDEKDDSTTAGDVAQLIRQELLPGERGGIPDLIQKEIEEGAPCEALKSFLEQEANGVRFASPAQKRAIHIAILSLKDSQIKQRFWDGCLGAVKVRLEEE